MKLGVALTLMIAFWIGFSEGCPCWYCIDGYANCAIPSTPYTKVPGPFSKDIKNIQMQHNKITRITAQSFGVLPELEVLRLDQNQITDIWPGAFSGMSSLNDLNLQNNKIFVLPDNLVHPNAPLKNGIKLNNNGLTNFPLSLLKKTRTFINVVGNPINCNCNSIIPEDLKNKVIGQCASPENLKGDDISSITYKDVNCSSCEGFNCNHGTCFAYKVGDVERRQCICDLGYRGKRCNIKYELVLPTEKPETTVSVTAKSTETPTISTTAIEKTEGPTTRPVGTKATVSTTPLKTEDKTKPKSTTDSESTIVTKKPSTKISKTPNKSKQPKTTSSTQSPTTKNQTSKPTARPKKTTPTRSSTTSTTTDSSSVTTTKVPTKHTKTITKTSTSSTEDVTSTQTKTENTTVKTTLSTEGNTPSASPTTTQAPTKSRSTSPHPKSTTRRRTTTTEAEIKPTKTSFTTLTKNVQKCRKLLSEAIKQPVRMRLYPRDDYEEVESVIKFIASSNFKNPKEHELYDPVQLCVINLLVQLVKNDD